MSRNFLYLTSLAFTTGVAMACSATTREKVFGDDKGGESDDETGVGASGSVSTSAGDPDGGMILATTGVGSGPSSSCSNPPDIDGDKDGFTGLDGDCNDCDPNANPGAVEVIIIQPGEDGGVLEPADEDCDNQVDNVMPTCDDDIDLADIDAKNGAKVLDICRQASSNDKRWGLLSAAYVRANGKPTVPSWSNVGVVDSFGPNVNVQKGKRMLALSSGHARLPGQPNACGSKSCSTSSSGTPPPGFPQDVPKCPGASTINDDTALELKLRAPTNATGYSFYFDFYSFEFPEWVCTAFNDQFIALAMPPPVGSIDGNISFDVQHNPVSVNIAFFEVCEFDPFYPQFPCALGPSELQGTGFDVWDSNAGATSWLKTTAPIAGGEELTIRFAIWDTGDQAWDSTVLIDNFQWIASGGVSVGTVVVPDPK